MSLRYKCLILDHDDTAVDSTASIHHPAHVEIMRQVRPGITPIDLEGWLRKNFDPGIMDYLVEELAFSEPEMEQELIIWREFTRSRVPRFYPGFIELLHEYRSRGGIITVVSHSEVDSIESHYRAADPTGISFPDAIFGWTYDADRRKPSPYPVLRILQRFALRAQEVLIVDDLKPGVEMARAAGVAIAAAGWGHRIPEIREFMEANCQVYLEDIEALGRMVLAVAD